MSYMEKIADRFCDLENMATIGRSIGIEQNAGQFAVAAEWSFKEKIHLIEPDVYLRASFAHRLNQLGMHTEIYASIDEIIDFEPKFGILMVNEQLIASGPAALSQFSGNALSKLPMIVYSTNPSVEKAVAAMKANAVNYVSPNDSDDTVIAAITEARSQAEENRERLALIQNSMSLVQRLSQRERQVLEFLVEGFSNKEIARRLDLSPRTVEIHRMHMFGKLNARNSAEAVRIWYAANA